MRKILALAFAALAISTCTAQQKTDLYTINGIWQNGNDGDSIFLVDFQKQAKIASVALKNHKFTLQVDAPNIAIYGVYAKPKGNASAIDLPLFAQNGNTSTLELKGANDYNLYGDPNNEIWQNLRKQEESLMKTIIATKADKTISPAEANRRIDSLQGTLINIYANGILDNIPQPICGILLSEFIKVFSQEQTNKILDAMKEKMPDDPYYKAIIAQRNAEAETAVGNKYKEIALVNLKGNMQSLSETVQKNKVTLVDFWASWCGPCMMEMPNVKNIYAQYHSQGLEIYAVSLDENQISWEGAIRRHQLPWIHVSDLKGWSSSAANTYNIRAIPATILIDRNGTIIGKNLRGAELKAAIEKALK